MKLRKTFIFQLFLAILTFSADNYGCCVEAGQEPPSPVILQLQAFNTNQTLVVRWLGRQSPQEQEEHYELQIARPDLVVNYSVSVRPLGGEGNHTFAWTSPLPLECANHSVRIRGFHNDSIFSSWSQWITNIGGSPARTTKIFPASRVLLEGTRPWLCCIPPPGSTITQMDFGNVRYTPISIGDRVKAIEANQLQIPQGRFKFLMFRCACTSGVERTYIYPSIPPEKPRNLSCETSDMKSVTCRWDPGKEDNLVEKLKRTQTLYINVPNQGNSSVQSSFKCEKSSCNFPVVTGLEEYHIFLLVSNSLGEQSVRHSFNISDRLQVFPEVGRVSAGVTEANLSLIAKQFLPLHDLRCEITLNNESRATVPCGGDRVLCGATVVGLLPNTNYSVRVRCGLKGKTPGRWSQITSFSTLRLVTLDLWRRIKEFSNTSRSVTLMWTLPDPGWAGAAVERYRVRVCGEGSHRTATLDGGLGQAHLSVGPGQCEVTVQADVSNSIPASITIPGVDAAEPRAAEQQVRFRTYLSWAGEDSATCGYTVEWCMLGKVSCALQWRKLPRENTSLLLNPRDYKDGVRYTFNIYGCTENGHKLLGIQTGYFLELKPVELLHQVEPVARTSSSVTLAWQYHEDDPTHPGFITGYLVTVQEVDTQGSPSQTQMLFNKPVMDPRKKWVTVEGLQEDKKYQFSLSALTRGGSGPVVITTVNTSSDLLVSLVKILTPLALLLAFAVLLCHQRNNLKSWQKVIFAFPDVTNIKAFELERFLQETSKKLDAQHLDECVCCDIEIINTKQPPQ